MMGKGRLAACSDGVLAIWLVPDQRIEQRLADCHG